MTLTAAGNIAPTGTAAVDLTAATLRTVMRRLNEAKAPSQNRYVALSPKDQAAILGDSNLANLLAFSQPNAVYNGYMGKLYGLDILWSQIPSTLLSYTVTLGSNSTFTFNGQTTGSITASTVTAASLQTALAALSTVGTGLVAVSGPTTGPFTVVFDSSLNAQALTASTATIAAATINGAFHKNAMIYAVRQFKPVPSTMGVMSAQVNDPDSGLSIRVSSQYDINNVSQRVNVDMLYGMQVLRVGQSIPLAA